MKTHLSKFCAMPFIAVAAAAVTLGGCAMPNSSNPTLSITRAQVRRDRATLNMQIENPSDMDVQVDAVQWTLQYGPLPTADGVWRLGVPLASKGKYNFTREILFTNPALDPSADLVELTGAMQVTTENDMGNMGLNGAGFVATSKAHR